MKRNSKRTQLLRMQCEESDLDAKIFENMAKMQQLKTENKITTQAEPKRNLEKLLGTIQSKIEDFWQQNPALKPENIESQIRTVSRQIELEDSRILNQSQSKQRENV